MFAAQELLGFIEVVVTGVLVVTLVQTASMFQHMLSAYVAQQIADISVPEKRVAKKSTKQRAARVGKTGVTGVLALVAEREKAALRREALTNVGAR